MSPQKWGIRQIGRTAVLKRWKRAMASRFSRARTTVAHTAWTTVGCRQGLRSPRARGSPGPARGEDQPFTACTGFAEAPRAITDMTTVPAVSHGRPWFAGAARYPSNAA